MDTPFAIVRILVGLGLSSATKALGMPLGRLCSQHLDLLSFWVRGGNALHECSCELAADAPAIRSVARRHPNHHVDRTVGDLVEANVDVFFLRFLRNSASMRTKSPACT